jgi:hypothetical protein
MANPTIIIKHRDTHALVLGVRDSDGDVVNLTGATTRLLIRPRGQAVEGTVLPATVTDATAGQVTHILTGTLAVGAYDLEVEITQNGAITTTPTDGYVTLVVQQDVA